MEKKKRKNGKSKSKASKASLQSAKDSDTHTKDRDSPPSPGAEKESSVGAGLTSYQATLQNGLSDSFSFRGPLAPIGSQTDNSRDKKVYKMECVYVMESDNIDVKPTTILGEYKIYSKEEEQCPRHFIKSFAECLKDQLVRVESLGPGLECVDPKFHGLQFQGSTVRSFFKCRSTKGDEVSVSLDITPVFTVTEPEFHKALDELAEKYGKEKCGKSVVETEVHLIPSPSKNAWLLSGANIEVGSGSLDSKTKTFLPYSKALSHKWNADDKSNEVWDPSEPRSRIGLELERYQNMEGGKEKAELGEELNRRMRYEHVNLTHNERIRFKEGPRIPPISINEEAIKHILLRHSVNIPGAFAPVSSPRITQRLMREVFRELTDMSCDTVPHAFLNGVSITKFTIDSHLHFTKEEVTQAILQQRAQIFAMLGGPLGLGPAPSTLSITGGDTLHERSTPELVEATGILNPSDPIRFTPDRMLLDLLDSPAQEKELVAEIKTKLVSPKAFALVSPPWLKVSEKMPYTPPPSHICDIFVLDDLCNAFMWTVFKDSKDEAEIRNIYAYMLQVARFSKAKIMKTGRRVVFTIFVECYLYNTDIGGVEMDMSEQMQAKAFFHNDDDFPKVREALVELVVAEEPYMRNLLHGVQRKQKTSSGQQQIAARSQQADVMLIQSYSEPLRLMITVQILRQGGKKREDRLYLCCDSDSQAFLDTLDLCDTVVVTSDSDLIDGARQGLYRGKTCIVFDWKCDDMWEYSANVSKVLLEMVTGNHDCRLYVFADEECQLGEQKSIEAD